MLARITLIKWRKEPEVWEDEPMASDVAELQFMAQKDENIKTSDDEPTKEEAEENKTESELLLKNPRKK